MTKYISELFKEFEKLKSRREKLEFLTEQQKRDVTHVVNKRIPPVGAGRRWNYCHYYTRPMFTPLSLTIGNAIKYLCTGNITNANDEMTYKQLEQYFDTIKN